MKEIAHKSLLDLDRAAMIALMESSGEPAYRAQQLLEAIFRQRVGCVEEISTLPQRLRAQLTEQGWSVGLPKVEKRFVSQDGTVRYLVELADGQSVETVWMPEGDGGESGEEVGDLAEPFSENSGASPSGVKAQSETSARIAALKRRTTQKQQQGQKLEDQQQQKQNWGRATICISSQVGCAVDCQFCLTALLGVKRNLTAGEIVGQVSTVLNDQKVSPQHDRINLVFMGMGEPFLNYDNFIKAVRLLVQEVGLAESRMTVSTAGIVPRISEFGRESIRPRLAISLNASNDELRTQLMPLNKKWNLESLMAAAREFPLRNRERVTFEYVLLHHVNDLPENAEQVVELLRGVRARVNLIALNPGPGIEFETPADDSVAAFQKILRDAGILAFVRRPRGRDIYAACGQLKRTVEISKAPAL
ncbi:MAG TPA: 23S rRNA (adenine(2503)-C(2))-methyltransferase RlmN [Candidatus Dormibacteraeota bacterium]|nr:23S rRNA (adenine(2503)-C(2))-methyltransferase RlmN [Candidatus Dormibacteraeota bacterium]